MRIFINTRIWKEELKEKFDGVIMPLREPTGKVNKLNNLRGEYVSLSVLGDTLGIYRNPEKAQLSRTGERAVIKENVYDGFAWSWVCPSDREHKEKILGLISQLDNSKILILQDIQFANERYCWCETCRGRKRVYVITNYIEEIKETYKGPVALTINPDPDLKVRYGIDLKRLTGIVEFLVIPIYSNNYAVTYWIDILVPYLLKKFKKFETYFEIYAVEPTPREVLKAIFTVGKYNPHGIIIYDINLSKYREIAETIRTDELIQKLINKIKNHTHLFNLFEQIKKW